MKIRKASKKDLGFKVEMNADDELGNKRDKKRKEERRRTRFISLILSSSMIVSVLIAFYAINMQSKVDQYKEELIRLELALKECTDLKQD